MIDSVPAGIAAAGFEFLDGAPERDALRPYCAILDVYDQKRRTRSDPGRAAETGRLVTPDFLFANDA